MIYQIITIFIEYIIAYQISFIFNSLLNDCDFTLLIALNVKFIKSRNIHHMTRLILS